MGTVKELLAIAEVELGVYESPPNSNNVKYNTWYYGRVVQGSAYPWCMAFCQWVYNQANVALPLKTASCTSMLTKAKSARMLVEKDFKPGDLALFNFEGKKTTSTHCGIVKEVVGSKAYTIEGNTSTTNDVNGGTVMLRERSISSIVGAVRPIFAGEEDLNMTKAEFLSSLTDKEAYDLLTKAQTYAATIKEPSWSTKEGYWAAALKSKVVDTDSPEALIKRDEVVTLMGRLGLIK